MVKKDFKKNNFVLKEAARLTLKRDQSSDPAHCGRGRMHMLDLRLFWYLTAIESNPLFSKYFESNVRTKSTERLNAKQSRFGDALYKPRHLEPAQSFS